MTRGRAPRCPSRARPPTSGSDASTTTEPAPWRRPGTPGGAASARRDDGAHSLLLDHPDLDSLLETGFADYAARLWEPIIALTIEKTL